MSTCVRSGPASWRGKDLVYGLSLNNSPGIEDPWNTLPVWGFPYTDSDYAPAPDVAPLIDGGLGQAVMGATAYGWLDSRWYLAGGAYSTPSPGTLRWLGADPYDPGAIHGLAPYGRAAFQTTLGGGTFEAGAFALKASLWPGRDRSSGYTDRLTDVGVDASWIRTIKSGTVTVNGRYTHEAQSLDATCALAMADGEIPMAPLSQCADNSLDELRADASYYWHDAVGVTIGAFDVTGSRNRLLYGDYSSGRPDSSGLQFQVDGTPFGRSGSPLGPRFNVRVGLQYTLYRTFNGARFNYDSSGRDAAANNTLRAFTWVAF